MNIILKICGENNDCFPEGVLCNHIAGGEVTDSYICKRYLLLSECNTLDWNSNSHLPISLSGPLFVTPPDHLGRNYNGDL